MATTVAKPVHMAASPTLTSTNASALDASSSQVHVSMPVNMHTALPTVTMLQRDTFELAGDRLRATFRVSESLIDSAPPPTATPATEDPVDKRVVLGYHGRVRTEVHRASPTTESTSTAYGSPISHSSVATMGSAVFVKVDRIRTTVRASSVAIHTTQTVGSSSQVLRSAS